MTQNQQQEPSELENTGAIWIGFLLFGAIGFFLSEYLLQSYSDIEMWVIHVVSSGLGVASGYFIGAAKPVREILYFIVEWRPY